MACVTYNIICVSDIRAKSCAPLAAVLYAANGNMRALTAEQKSFAKGKVFCLRWFRLKKGDTQGGTPWETFASFGAGQRKCRAA
ncbi:MAG: hypothetical protein IKJ91_04270 [Clostridia bacterium]|nr:hypothetical protein [Clostridia bacterium]